MRAPRTRYWRSNRSRCGHNAGRSRDCGCHLDSSRRIFLPGGERDTWLRVTLNPSSCSQDEREFHVGFSITTLRRLPDVAKPVKIGWGCIVGVSGTRCFAALLTLHSLEPLCHLDNGHDRRGASGRASVRVDVQFFRRGSSDVGNIKKATRGQVAGAMFARYIKVFCSVRAATASRWTTSRCRRTRGHR